jgi:hypothetical protein
MSGASGAKKPFEPQPGKPLTQFKLMLMLGYEPRVLRKHILVFGFIVDWWHQDYGNALASVRHIVRLLKERDPHGRGLYMGDVHSALTDLVEWGWLRQEKGSGRKASRYIPAWQRCASVLESPNANDGQISVLEFPNVGVLESPNATATSVLESTNEDPSTVPGLQTGVRVDGNEFKAAPVAPLAEGLAATAAVPALGAFEQFWSIWPRKHGKAAARVAFAKVPDELHTAIVEAAGEWRDHYAEHGTDRKWIPEPANWLAKERWDEDLPIIHDDAKGAAIAKAKANAPAVSRKKEVLLLNPAMMAGEVSPFSPFGTFTAEIAETAILYPGPGEEKLRLELTCDGLVLSSHEFLIQSPDVTVQQRGKAMLASIARAVGLDVDAIEDSDQLLNRPFRCMIGMPADQILIAYAPLAANDNFSQEAAA